MTGYDYTTIGFDAFMTRSIDSPQVPTLDLIDANSRSTELNYDQAQTTGSLGSTLRIGNVELNGVKGRISIYDNEGHEITRIGELDD